MIIIFLCDSRRVPFQHEPLSSRAPERDGKIEIGSIRIPFGLQSSGVVFFQTTTLGEFAPPLYPVPVRAVSRGPCASLGYSVMHILNRKPARKSSFLK